MDLFTVSVDYMEARKGTIGIDFSDDVSRYFTFEELYTIFGNELVERLEPVIVKLMGEMVNKLIQMDKELDM